MRARQHGQSVLEFSEYGEYIAVGRLAGLGWNLHCVTWSGALRTCPQGATFTLALPSVPEKHGL